MNIFLEKLLDKFELSEKDKYEIKQIFDFLPNYKKQNIIKNFEELSKKIKKIEEDINIEREVLVWETLKEIKNVIETVKSEK